MWEGSAFLRFKSGIIILYIRRSISLNINRLEETLRSSIEESFTQDELDELAREAGFVKRKSPLDGYKFLDLIVFHSSSLKMESLNDLCITLKEEHNVPITKQSLDERFSLEALNFLKLALEKLLSHQLEDHDFLVRLKSFRRVLIKDSVCFQIDESLREFFPGSGGSGSSASLRIQFEYDILNGQINDLSISGFNNQDSTNSKETIELLEAGDLVIRDLAYMGIEVLELIIANKSFFLCRLGTNTNAYELVKGEYQELSFKKLEKHMRKNGLSRMTKKVFIGASQKLPVRLVIYLLPSDEAEKRRRKKRAEYKKKTKKISQQWMDRSGLNLFITNTEEEQIAEECVWTIYRIRWQIELIFKIWKSLGEIDKVKKVKLYRFLCYIIAKLIFLSLCWQILWRTAKKMYRETGLTLSFYKAFKTLKNQKHKLKQIFYSGKDGSVSAFLEDFYQKSIRHHVLEQKEKGKGKLPALEMFLKCFPTR